jgi:YD repeat-containing protein
MKMTDYFGNETNYAYDAISGRLKSITGPGSKAWNFAYGKLGRPTRYTHPNGMVTAYGYDNLGRLVKIEHGNGTEAWDSFAYTLDPVGNVTAAVESFGKWTTQWAYGYDARYRLTGAIQKDSTGAETGSFAYQYDAINRTLPHCETMRL